MAGDGIYLFQSLTILLGSNKNQHTALRQETVSCLYDWDRFCTYVPQYTRERYDMIIGQDAVLRNHVEMVAVCEFCSLCNI